MSRMVPFKIEMCSHYIFTDFPKESLEQRGFVFPTVLVQEEEGLVSYRMPLLKPNKEILFLEFSRISDEEEFQKTMTRAGGMGNGGFQLLRPHIRLKKNGTPKNGTPKNEPRSSHNGAGEDSSIQVIGSIPVDEGATSSSIVAPRFRLSSSFSEQPLDLQFKGVYWGLGTEEKNEWIQFLGEPPVEGGWSLEDGTRIELAEEGDGLHAFYSERKDFLFWAVILETPHLDLLINNLKPDRIEKWKGQRVAMIQEYLTDWDLLIVEKK